MSGLPGEPRTDANGFYTAAVPASFAAEVWPTAPGFSFDPASRSYSGLTSSQTGQDYAATYVGGADDAYEENDSFDNARDIAPGVYTNLVGNDEDWFKINVGAADKGNDLRIQTRGLAVPNPGAYKDIDWSFSIAPTSCSQRPRAARPTRRFTSPTSPRAHII